MSRQINNAIGEDLIEAPKARCSRPRAGRVGARRSLKNSRLFRGSASTAKVRAERPVSIKICMIIKILPNTRGIYIRIYIYIYINSEISFVMAKRSCEHTRKIIFKIFILVIRNRANTSFGSFSCTIAYISS